MLSGIFGVMLEDETEADSNCFLNFDFVERKVGGIPQYLQSIALYEGMNSSTGS